MAVRRESREVRTVALMLESDGPGGAEIFLIQSAVELRTRGYRVLPVLPERKSGWLGEQFRSRGFEPATFHIRGALDWECLQDLVVTLDRERVDAVHSHEFAMAVFGTAASRILRIPHVITLHANQEMTRAARDRVALRWAIRNSDATVAVSDDFRAHLLNTLRIAPDSVQTILNGIPDPAGEAAGPIQEFSLKPEEVVLLAAGNLSERKGHIVLLEALDRVHRQGCQIPWRLIIAGDGLQRPRLEAFLEESGIEARVHLPGHRADVADLQAAADILVMPSLWEGLPLAILEGMYSGNAVIGSGISGIPEAVRDGVDGLLTPPGDVQALAGALRELLEDAELRRRMGRAASERARTRFSIARMMDEYEALYSRKPLPVAAPSASSPASE